MPRRVGIANYRYLNSTKPCFESDGKVRLSKFSKKSAMLQKCQLPWCSDRTFFVQMFCALATAACFSTPAVAQPSDASQFSLSGEAYLAANGGTLISAGRAEIDDRRMACGSAPTILDTRFRDFGGSFAGFIVLNPNLFVGLATPVKLWIFSHECAHQTVGADEVKADCVAVQRGRREGWLSPAGLAQVCEFMEPARGDQSHFTGTKRCELMRQCFDETKAHPTR